MSADPPAATGTEPAKPARKKPLDPDVPALAPTRGMTRPSTSGHDARVACLGAGPVRARRTWAGGNSDGRGGIQGVVLRHFSGRLQHLREELEGERVLVADLLAERPSRPRQPRADAKHELAGVAADVRRDALEQ